MLALLLIKIFVSLLRLYDLVSAMYFDAWILLCNLVSLFWQPQSLMLMNILWVLQSCVVSVSLMSIFRPVLRLQSVNSYIGLFARYHDDKSKFHFILYLPTNVQHFGPVVLFTTETFESYNTITWSKSMQSNHLASI